MGTAPRCSRQSLSFSSQKLITVACLCPVLPAKYLTRPTNPGLSQMVFFTGQFLPGTVSSLPPKQVTVDLVDDSSRADIFRTFDTVTPKPIWV